MLFTEPGVKDKSFTEQQRLFFDLVASRGGGYDIREIESKTGLNYEEQVNIVFQLRNKGVPIRALDVGRWHDRFYYSPYAEDYEFKIKGDIENE